MQSLVVLTLSQGGVSLDHVSRLLGIELQLRGKECAQLARLPYQAAGLTKSPPVGVVILHGRV